RSHTRSCSTSRGAGPEGSRGRSCDRSCEPHCVGEIRLLPPDPRVSNPRTGTITGLLSTTESRPMREKDVSRLLTDEYAERILVATQSTSRPAQEISGKDHIPIAGC